MHDRIRQTTSYKLIQKVYDTFRLVGILIFRDTYNIAKYGRSSPKFGELIWVDPAEIKLGMPSVEGMHPRYDSAKVIEKEWPSDKAKPLSQFKKIQFCKKRWVQDIPWEDTGVYEYLNEIIKVKKTVDECSNHEDIVKRYERLDEIFEEIYQSGEIRTRKKLKLLNIREYGGPVVHIGPEGELFFAGAGVHRFYISKVQKKPLPAQVGCVHISSIYRLVQLRNKAHLKV